MVLCIMASSLLMLSVAVVLFSCAAPAIKELVDASNHTNPKYGERRSLMSDAGKRAARFARRHRILPVAMIAAASVSAFIIGFAVSSSGYPVPLIICDMALLPAALAFALPDTGKKVREAVLDLDAISAACESYPYRRQREGRYVHAVVMGRQTFMEDIWDFYTNDELSALVRELSDGRIDLGPRAGMSIDRRTRARMLLSWIAGKPYWELCDSIGVGDGCVCRWDREAMERIMSGGSWSTAMMDIAGASGLANKLDAFRKSDLLCRKLHDGSFGTDLDYELDALCGVWMTMLRTGERPVDADLQHVIWLYEKGARSWCNTDAENIALHECIRDGHSVTDGLLGTIAAVREQLAVCPVWEAVKAGVPMEDIVCAGAGA